MGGGPAAVVTEGVRTMPVEKPSLGPMPEWRFTELRINELLRAITERIEQNDYSTPVPWIGELARQCKNRVAVEREGGGDG